MRFYILKNKRGFTLVELLVVIAIIGILAAFIMADLSKVRTKALDARKQLEINLIGNALALFYDKFNRMPGNYNYYNVTTQQHSLTSISGPGWVLAGACEGKVNDAPGASDTVGSDLRNIYPEAFNKSMQELVDAGFLPGIPKSPGGSGYCYLDRGPNSASGAIIMTDLDASNPSMEGLPASCRPFTGLTWCRSDVENHQYCRCNPY
jgi:prepilin-type N-terminal cleavage/methylation domain-containing protein